MKGSFIFNVIFLKEEKKIDTKNIEDFQGIVIIKENI